MIIMKILNLNYKSFLLLIAVVLLVFNFISDIYKDRQISILKQNLEAANHNTEQWRNDYGELVTTSLVEITSLRSDLMQSDANNKKLIDANKRMGIKLRNTEYLLGIKAKVEIDTIIKVDLIHINDTLFKEIDSLQIESFKLIRTKFSDNNKAKYKISYKPELTASINTFKKDRWKFHNIFIPRQKYYKIDLIANDSIFIPTSLIVLKRK